VALHEAGVLVPKAVSINTNISAFLTFMTTNEAVTAHDSFVKGLTSISPTSPIDGKSSSSSSGSNGGLVSSRISAHPAYVVEVSGMDPETPTSQIDAIMTGES
jgi:hypothetical protein